MTEKEQELYLIACLLLKDGYAVFTPHKLGELGYETTSTYFYNLYDKGLFERVKKGQYMINYVVFDRAYRQYLSNIEQRQIKAESATLHRFSKKYVIKRYEEDKVNIRITFKIVLNGEEKQLRDIASKTRLVNELY